MYASVSVTPFGMSRASCSISTTGTYSSRNHASAASWRDISTWRACIALKAQASTASASAA